MTPEGSQSSEEMLNIDENQSAAPSSSSSSGDVLIRVKNVSEINSNEAEANPTPPTKRKLPSWMLASTQQKDSEGTKKRRTQNVSTRSAAAEDQPESTVTPSTTRSGVPSNADQIASISQVSTKAGGSREVEAEKGVTDASSAQVDVKDEAEADVAPSHSASTSNGKTSSLPVSAVKAEPDNEDSDAVGQITPTSPGDIKPAVKVEKEEATSSTTRTSCKFGIRCYRQNPIHRREEAHPGDKDYQRPDYPTPPDGTPDCPYGNLCYRRNPVHFQQFSHPPSTDFQKNWKDYKMRLRQRKQPTVDPNASYSDFDDDADDYDLEDPFLNDDSDDEYIPNSYDKDDDDDDDFL